MIANDNNFVYDDGGRIKAGFKGDAGDCVVRAVAIAAKLDYLTLYQTFANGNASERVTKRSKKLSGRKTARNGIHTHRKWFKDFMGSLGWVFTPTMGIGTGCKVHLRADELPSGRLILSLSRHLCAVIDGVIHDTHDPSRDGTRCVYGYWSKRDAV